MKAFPEAFLETQLGLAGEGGICWCRRRGHDSRWMEGGMGGLWHKLSWSATIEARRWSAWDLCSWCPVTITHAREELSPNPWTLPACFFSFSVECSRSIETAWSNRSAFWVSYECLGVEKRHMYCLQGYAHPPTCWEQLKNTTVLAAVWSKRAERATNGIASDLYKQCLKQQLMEKQLTCMFWLFSAYSEEMAWCPRHSRAA